MKRYLTTLLLPLALGVASCSESTPLPEPPANQHVFGDAGSEIAGDIVALPDGGYLIVGASKAHDRDDYDLYIVKASATGEELQAERYGVEGYSEIGWKIAACANGEYAILGTRQASANSAANFQITHLDADLNLLQQTESSITTPNTGLTLSGASFYQLAGATGYIAGFTTDSYPVTARFDADGSKVDEQSYADFLGGKLLDLFCKAADSSYVLFTASVQDNQSNERIAALMFDPLGNYLGYNVVPTGGLYAPKVLGATTLRDGSYALSLCERYESGHDVALIPADLSAATVRSRGSVTPYYHMVGETATGDLLMAGFDSFQGYSYGSTDDFRVLRCDSLGFEISNTTYGGSNIERPRVILGSLAGPTMILGETQSYGAGGTDIYLVVLQ